MFEIVSVIEQLPAGSAITWPSVAALTCVWMVPGHGAADAAGAAARTATLTTQQTTARIGGPTGTERQYAMAR